MTSIASRPAETSECLTDENVGSSGCVVQVRDLRKTYHHWSRRRNRAIEALRGVTLKAQAGEVFGLLGPNGAGKTTLIKTLLGVVRPSSGNAKLFGEAAGSAAASRRVGYLPESLRIDRHHTARSALRFYGRMSGMSESNIGKRSDELLDLVGLAGRDQESVKRFSKGMYQRLGLAQALLHDPDLLILDEPTDGLDPVGRSQVRKVLEYLKQQGKTIFLNSHILQEVEMVCTRVAILAQGEIRGIGTIEELSRLARRGHAVFTIVRRSEGLSVESLMHRLSEGLGIVLKDVELESIGENTRVTISTDEQAAIDSTVDWMRGQGYSIVLLSIRRPSLEQTFLKLVGPTAETPPADVSSGEATHVDVSVQETSASQRESNGSLDMLRKKPEA